MISVKEGVTFKVYSSSGCLILSGRVRMVTASRVTSLSG